jgi:hypothetical protein
MDEIVDDYDVDFSRVPRYSVKGGVIVESRKHPHLGLVLRNFVYMLPDWSLTIFHVEDNREFIEEILGPNHTVRLIQLKTPTIDIDYYNKLLLSEWFYRRLDTETFLVFQCDSFLRSGDIEPYLAYDYVGALWPGVGVGDKVVKVGNGGLSLRKRSVCLAILGLEEMIGHEDLPEDVFFALGLEYLPGANKCPEHIAASFSVESIYHPDPLGWHQAYKFFRGEEWDNLKRIRESKRRENL